MSETFQMQETVDKQIINRKVVGGQFNKNFARIFSERKRQDISDFVFVSSLLI